MKYLCLRGEHKPINTLHLVLFLILCVALAIRTAQTIRLFMHMRDMHSSKDVLHFLCNICLHFSAQGLGGIAIILHFLAS